MRKRGFLVVIVLLCFSMSVFGAFPPPPSAPPTIGSSDAPSGTSSGDSDDNEPTNESDSIPIIDLSYGSSSRSSSSQSDSNDNSSSLAVKEIKEDIARLESSVQTVSESVDSLKAEINTLETSLSEPSDNHIILYSVIALGVVLLTAIFSLFYYMRQHLFGTSSHPHPSTKMDSATAQRMQGLKQYVSYHRQGGVHPAQIKQELLKNGHDPKEIDAVIGNS